MPRKLLLSQVPFVEDPAEAMEMMDAEEAKRQKQQREMFAPESFRPGEEETEAKTE